MVNVLIGLGVVIGAVIMVYVIAPLFAKRNGNKVFSTALHVATIVVEAVEQEIQGEKSGPEKKAAALAAVKEILKNDFNIEVSEILLDKAIEAAVFAMNWAKNQVAKKTLPEPEV